MAYFKKFYRGSLELKNPADYPGEIWLCRERGSSQACAWMSTGGETGAIWQPLGFSYIGLAASCPLPTDLRERARVEITDAGGIQEVGSSTLVDNPGRFFVRNSLFWPLQDVILWGAYGTAAAAIATSGAGSVANGAAAFMTPAGGTKVVAGPGIIHAGSALALALVAKRTAGTTNNLGLQVAITMDGTGIFGVPFNDASATAETAGEGWGIASGTTTWTAQARDNVAAQSTNGYADATITDLTTASLTFNVVKSNQSGGASTDNLSLFKVEVVLKARG